MSKLVLSCFYFTSFFPLWISILFIDIKSYFENTENLWTERISISVILLANLISLVLFLVFFVTLGFLCIRHNHFSVNILLEILNYKMFTCELEDEDKNVVQRKIISHRTLNTHKGEYIYLKSLNNEIKLDIEN